MNRVGISLGNVCRSAIWAVQNDYRGKKEDGYNTCPFDLMHSNYKGIIKCINDNFKYFCDTRYLCLIDGIIQNTYYNFTFNHESPKHDNLYLNENWETGAYHFFNNGWSNLIERYNKRIKSFNEYLTDPNNYIYFIIDLKYDKLEDDTFIDLINALNNRYPNLKYEIINITEKID
jgi:hypothetical protein